jgi:hypothetical protein
MNAAPELLASIVAEVSVVSGLPAGAISLRENADGTFTISILGDKHTGTLNAVHAWAMSRAREIAIVRAGAQAVEPDHEQARMRPR